MFSTKSLFAATAALSLIATSSAAGNVAVYWGSGAGQARLRTFCDESSIDIIPIGFLSLFPQQGNGFPKQDFGNACWGDTVYYGPGNDHSKDSLFTRCPTVQEDIPYCQSIGKKIVLSLGGGTTGYQLTGAAAGTAFADFLWGAYGPKRASWIAAGGVRPLDRGLTNTTSETIDVDGFDFDIEHTSNDNQQGYIACINRLRILFASVSKKYLITGAPQCPLPEANMGTMIAAAQFDILWIQFYNNGGYGCNARDWANANPNYATNGVQMGTNLNYNAWKTKIQSGASKNAKLYLGLIGAPNGTDCTKASYGDYVNPTEANNLISAYKSDSQFGGVMLWDATASINNKCVCKPYYSIIKDSLNGIKPQTGTVCTSSTTSATSTSKTSTSSTSSKPITTTSSSTTKTSSSSTSPTSSSTSSKPTTTTSSSTIKTSSSSTSLTSSATSSKPTTSLSSSSTSATSTSSSSSLSSSSSSSSSTSATTTLSSSSSSSASVTSSTSSSTSETSSSTSGSVTSTSSSASVTSTSSSSSSSTSETSSSTSGSVTSTSSSASVTSTSSSSSETSTSSGTSSSLSSTTETSSVETTSSSSSSSTFPTFTPPWGNTTSTSKTSISVTSSDPTTLPTSTTETTPTPSGTTSNDPNGPTTPLPTVTSTTEYTTSTHYTTKTETVTSCPPTITNCPIGSVVTRTIAEYTTVCPVGDNNGNGPAPTPAPVQYTTSTVFATKIYTVTACPPSVQNCPQRGSVTTEIIPVYTTVCPVAEAGNGGKGESKPTPAPVVPGAPGVIISYTTATVSTTKVLTITACAPGVKCPGSITTVTIPYYTTVYPLPKTTSTTTTFQSLSTQYVTVKYTLSTSAVSVIPIPVSTPVAPYPTPGPCKTCGYGTGTGTAYYPKGTAASSVSVKYVEVSPVPVSEAAPAPTFAGKEVKAGSTTISAVAVPVVSGSSTPASPSATPIQGAASKMGGSALAIACAMVMGVLML